MPVRAARRASGVAPHAAQLNVPAVASTAALRSDMSFQSAAATSAGGMASCGYARRRIGVGVQAYGGHSVSGSASRKLKRPVGSFWQGQTAA
jgi:hypothetical protein